MIKSCYIDQELKKYFTIPSLNIDQENQTINYIESFIESYDFKKVKEEEIKDLVAKDISKKKYSMIVNNLIDRYEDKT